MRKKRTYADRAEYLIKAVSKRRKRIRDLALKQLGNQCMICGYHRCPQALDFHHRDAKRKTFGISEGEITRSWARVQKELEQCVLLCANCHREVHVGISQLPAGMPG